MHVSESSFLSLPPDFLELSFTMNIHSDQKWEIFLQSFFLPLKKFHFKILLSFL